MEEQIINDDFIKCIFFKKQKLSTHWKQFMIKYVNVEKYLFRKYPNLMNIEKYNCKNSDPIQIGLYLIYLDYNEFPNIDICPICGKYKKWFIDINGIIYSYTCGDQQCIKQLSVLSCKKTCMEKYGVDSIAKLQSTKEKIKQTNIKRYGYSCSFQNEEVKIKYRENSIKKYGVSHPAKLQENINKVKNTKMLRYGSESYNNYEKIKQTCLQRYGVEYIFQSCDFINMAKNTKLNKYGSETYVNIEKIKQTKLERYGDPFYTNIEQMKQTKLERYGDPFYTNTEQTKQTKLERYGDPFYTNTEQIKQTKLERYGNPFYTNMEQIKQTCLDRYGLTNGGGSILSLQKIYDTKLERYGDPFYTNIEQVKQTKLERYGDPFYTNIERIKQTCLEKYGIDNYSKTIECRNKISSILSSLEVQEKINNTKRKNNSFNTSKPENELYEYILSYFPNAVRSYKSNLYPFNCDFYIPDLDLYIEFQGSWTHGKHPFDELNQDDIELLNKWKDKNTKYYNNAIQTWTIRDVKKRVVAKQNNLNYKELWDLNEAKQFIDSLIKY